MNLLQVGVFTTISHQGRKYGRYNLARKWLLLAITSLLLLNDKFSYAYKSGAGSCSAGESSAKFNHLDTRGGTRPVESGGSLGDIGIQVVLDDAKEFPTDSELEIERDYRLTITADNFFRGILIRAESSSKDVDIEGIIRPTDFSLQPAIVCFAPLVGLTHAGNTDKESVTVILRMDSVVSDVQLDITVVVRNDDEGAISAYSGYSVSFVESAETSIPTQTATVSPTTALVIPEATSRPTSPTPTLAPILLSAQIQIELDSVQSLMPQQTIGKYLGSLEKLWYDTLSQTEYAVASQENIQVSLTKQSRLDDSESDIFSLLTTLDVSGQISVQTNDGPIEINDDSVSFQELLENAITENSSDLIQDLKSGDASISLFYFSALEEIRVYDTGISSMAPTLSPTIAPTTPFAVPSALPSTMIPSTTMNPTGQNIQFSFEYTLKMEPVLGEMPTETVLSYEAVLGRFIGGRLLNDLINFNLASVQVDLVSQKSLDVEQAGTTLETTIQVNLLASESNQDDMVESLILDIISEDSAALLVQLQSLPNAADAVYFDRVNLIDVIDFNASTISPTITQTTAPTIDTTGTTPNSINPTPSPSTVQPTQPSLTDAISNIPTTVKAVTTSPTVGQTPETTFSEKCSICGVGNKAIFRTGGVFVFGSTFLDTCGALEDKGQQQLISPEECALIQTNVDNCGCTPISTMPSMMPSDTPSAVPTNAPEFIEVVGQVVLKITSMSSLLSNPEVTKFEESCADFFGTALALNDPPVQNVEVFLLSQSFIEDKRHRTLQQEATPRPVETILYVVGETIKDSDIVNLDGMLLSLVENDSANLINILRNSYFYDSPFWAVIYIEAGRINIDPPLPTLEPTFNLTTLNESNEEPTSDPSTRIPTTETTSRATPVKDTMPSSAFLEFSSFAVVPTMVIMLILY